MTKITLTWIFISFESIAHSGGWLAGGTPRTFDPWCGRGTAGFTKDTPSPTPPPPHPLPHQGKSPCLLPSSSKRRRRPPRPRQFRVRVDTSPSSSLLPFFLASGLISFRSPSPLASFRRRHLRVQRNSTAANVRCPAAVNLQAEREWEGEGRGSIGWRNGDGCVGLAALLLLLVLMLARLN